MPKKKTLYNPLLIDFSVKYDIYEDGNPQTFTIKAGEVVEFSKIIGEHMKKHLATAVMDKRGVERGNAELTLQKINEEIDLS